MHSGLHQPATRDDAVPPPTDLAAWLTELEAAHAAATPGEWAMDERRPADVVNHKGFPVAYAVTTLDRDADAALIVAAVNALPLLVAAVRAVAELADALRIDAAETARESESDDLNPEEGERLAGKAQGLEEAADALTAALTPERTTP